MTDTPASVLLIEDSLDDVALMRRAFRKLCIANPLHVVENGEIALAYLMGTGDFADRERYPLPALVLSDLKTPRMSGLELLAWRKDRPDQQRIPVVVLSSSDHKMDMDRAYELGAASYLIKPRSFEGLMSLIVSLEFRWVILASTEEPAQ